MRVPTSRVPSSSRSRRYCIQGRLRPAASQAAGAGTVNAGLPLASSTTKPLPVRTGLSTFRVLPAFTVMPSGTCT
jgi:hypothetical protein